MNKKGPHSVYTWTVVLHTSEGPFISRIYIKLKDYELYESRTMDLFSIPSNLNT